MQEAYFLEQEIEKAQQGNDIIRQRILSTYKPYIINTVGHLCKRYITWSDEESSIGLIAFNKAIDTYDTIKGRKFLSYAYLLIQRALINHFHSNKNEAVHLSLNHNSDDGIDSAEIELQKSVQLYHQKQQSYELVDEILELDEELQHFGIRFEQLEEVSPKHKDTRETLREISNLYIREQELLHELLIKKRLAINAFSRKTGYPAKTLERYRKYIITLIIIKLHPEWLNLTSFVFAVQGKEGSV
jgi:RNA polymerase sigma factor